MLQSDTICAIITPQGMGAVATLRLSGREAVAIADAVFRSAREGKRLADQRGATLHYGTVADAGGNAVDDVVVSLFRAPHSFTGEDIVEVSCHGSVVIQHRLLQLFIDHGARMALPGEFSQRAFLNGKMDLSQAEAVADLIASESEAARRVALGQLKGGFSNMLKVLRDKLIEFATLLELELDFSEEEVEFADRSQLSALVDNVISEVSRMADSFRLGNAIKNGIPTVIVGAPNVGKSTLLNRLTGDDRAIVSDIQGTTRDAIEEVIAIGDLSFRLVDTAGIRHTDDVVEQMGISRTFRYVDKAEVVILLVDASMSREDIEAQCAETMKHIGCGRRHVVIAINKDDVAATPWADEEWSAKMGAAAMCKISAKVGQGVDVLRHILTGFFSNGSTDSEDIVVTNIRHYEALVEARDALENVREGLSSGLSGELVSIHLHEATDALTSITGEITSNDVLHNIFRKFCIGK